MSNNPPFGMEAMAASFERACRLTQNLFGCMGATVVLMEEGRTWRSRDPGGPLPRDYASEQVAATAETLWIEDAFAHPRYIANPELTTRLGLRCYIGAPIIQSDGRVLGVLCALDTQPRPRDESLLALLVDIADSIADGCERLRLMERAKQSSAAAQAANETLSSLIRHVPLGVVMTDRDMVILEANPRWISLQGLDEVQVTGRNLYELAPYTKEHHAKHLEVLKGHHQYHPRLRVEVRGQVLWLRVDLTPWREPNGEVGGVMITVSDVTQMVEALDRVERSEQRLQMAVRLAELHVWEIDYKRKVLEKVGDAEAFFDKPMTYEDVLGDILCGVHLDDRAEAGASLQKRIQHGRHDPLICRTRRTDGKEVWAASAAEVILGDDGKPERIVGMFHNLTRMKLAEKSLIEAVEIAEAANRSKSEFLANMSHEIRTPLNGVLGMAQVIEADELSDVQRERIKVVRESGSALLAILNDVLDLSKIQAGKLELDIADFDIDDLAPVVVAAFEGVAAAKDVALTVAIDDSAAGAWKGDILRLRQVVSNLVSNALKFTSEGEVALSVRHEGGSLVLAVRDSGIGIDPEKIPLLFEKFAQEDASTTRRYGGTGLGLSICRELSELMGGRIEVASAKGSGSTFSVILPLERGLAIVRTAKTVRPTPAQKEASEAPLRILAAEDNSTNQLVLRALLAPLGVDLVMVGNGREAVETFQAGLFDLVLMDVQMPEMNGVEATRAIRQWEQAQRRRRTPILSLTANVMTYQVDEYRAAGMDGAIAKPIEVEKLYAAMDEALTKADMAVEAAA